MHLFQSIYTHHRIPEKKPDKIPCKFSLQAVTVVYQNKGQADQGSHFWAGRAIWAEKKHLFWYTIASKEKILGLLLFSAYSRVDLISLTIHHQLAAISIL